MKGSASHLAIAVAVFIVLGVFSGCRPQGGEPESAEREPEPPRVGCTACHVKVSDERNYTLGAEARAVPNHPATAPDGTPLDDNAPFSSCMPCHATAADGRGVAARVSMALIAHPAHMFSEHFQEFDGNCWSCHTLDADGTFLVITDKVEVDENGIPTEIPIEKVWVPGQGMAGGQ